MFGFPWRFLGGVWVFGAILGFQGRFLGSVWVFGAIWGFSGRLWIPNALNKRPTVVKMVEHIFKEGQKMVQDGLKWSKTWPRMVEIVQKRSETGRTRSKMGQNKVEVGRNKVKIRSK